MAKEKQEEQKPPATEEEENSEEETEEKPEGSGSADEEPKGGKKEESKDEFPWDEHNRLKREAAERSKADRDAKRKRDKEEGKLSETLSDETKRADEAEAEVTRMKRERLVERVAKNVGFKDPEDAPRYLKEEDMDDERAAEKVLRDLKKSKPHLFDEQRRSGGDIEEEEDEDDDRKPGKSGEGFGFQRLRTVKRKN